VYGDFDTDGVTEVTLLMQAIGAMGGDIRPYIPHRLREGYGLNTEAIEQLAAEGMRLLITVDCGISNVREVAHAQERGIDVIVTDHHTPPAVLPEAYAVVNPKQPGCEYPYKQLVGVGIAYKLVQALARLGVKMPLRGRDLLDVVALGTVTDMGPLNGENRVLVQAGLESINATQRPGL
jgi:single-stranded-DNA-specific exonuclease